MESYMDKVIIVEGLTDKKQVQPIIKEPFDIVCTNGTIGFSRLEAFIEEMEGKDLYVLVDADSSGEKLRKQLKRTFPEASHIYIDRAYREVAAAPRSHLAIRLKGAGIEIHSAYLEG